MRHESEAFGVFIDRRQPVKERVALIAPTADGVVPLCRFDDMVRRAEGIVLKTHRAAPGSIFGLNNEVAERGFGA